MDNPVTWFEVLGPEPDQTAKFYSEVFGWETQTLPEFNYTLVDTHAGSGINGGIGDSQGAPPTTSFYVQPSDLQGTLDKALSLGASEVMPVTETSMVTFAMFSDPAGNVIGLVAPSEQGSPVSAGDGVPVDWFEVVGPDARALWAFYRELFGWDIHEGDSEDFLYGEVHPGEGEEGAAGGIGSSPDGQPKVTMYAKVADLQVYLDRVEAGGGTTLVPITDIGDLTFSVFADPQGSRFGIYTPAAH